jgi:hypothetical protein
VAEDVDLTVPWLGSSTCSAPADCSDDSRKHPRPVLSLGRRFRGSMRTGTSWSVVQDRPRGRDLQLSPTPRTAPMLPAGASAPACSGAQRTPCLRVTGARSWRCSLTSARVGGREEALRGPRLHEPAGSGDARCSRASLKGPPALEKVWEDEHCFTMSTETADMAKEFAAQDDE